MKRFLLVVGVLCAFVTGYGIAAEAYPAGGIFGRAEYRGYFTNSLDYYGTYVLPAFPSYGGNAFPVDMDSASEFISFIKFTKLDIDGNGSGDMHERTGAAFIIHTMIGSSVADRRRPPTSAQIAEWESRVRAAEAAGRISWNYNYSHTINSYYQGAKGGGSPNDDAFYDDRGTSRSIVFRNASGTIVYAIRRQCANPVGNGSLTPIPDTASFNMTGRTTVSDTTVLPGQSVTFRHYVSNQGPDSTSPTSIAWRARITNDGVVGGLSGSGNGGTFTRGQEKNVFNENVTIPASAAPGDRICRWTEWTPDTQAGGSSHSSSICAVVQYDFDLTPIINFTVNGATPPGSIAEQGDSIRFTYAVNNGGSTVSQSVNCSVYAIVRPGSYSKPTPPDSASNPAGYVPPPTGCPRTFPASATTILVTETITAGAVNQTICRALWVDPATAAGGNRGTEVCVRIVAKPYLKVYGGDVAAGGGLESAPDTCTSNTDAAIISWNKGTSGSYAGAGTQYAAYALGAITDFATGRGNSVGGTNPWWLSFANSVNTNATTGQFGGLFESAPCITDYYAQMPAATSSVPASVSAMVTGAYSGGEGNDVTLAGGNINPGQNTSVFIDGDVYITGNITYPGSWNYGNIPLFQLVVRGNIYIASGVTQLDGVYIAQTKGSGSGTIYTCASGMSAPLLADGAFYNDCNNKLTINGAFIANSVEFLRTAGSLSRSTAAESSPASPAGEVFNFSPALWITQPIRSVDNQNNYDAITSLPPVL